MRLVLVAAICLVVWGEEEAAKADEPTNQHWRVGRFETGDKYWWRQQVGQKEPEITLEEPNDVWKLGKLDSGKVIADADARIDSLLGCLHRVACIDLGLSFLASAAVFVEGRQQGGARHRALDRVEDGQRRAILVP